MTYIRDREFSAKIARRTVPVVQMEVELASDSESVEVESVEDTIASLPIIDNVGHELVSTIPSGSSSSRQPSARERLLSSGLASKSADKQQEAEAKAEKIQDEVELTTSKSEGRDEEEAEETEGDAEEVVDPETLLYLESLRQQAQEEEEKQKLKLHTAAVLIQRVVARGRAARKAAANKRKCIEDERVQRALCQAGFMELTADILANTMFNLMQEASYGEFSVMAEPIKFMLKK